MKSPNVRVTNWNEANIGGSPNNIITGIETEDTLNVNVVNNTQQTEGKAIPKNLPIPSVMTNTNGVMVRHLTKDGVLYGSMNADQRVFKSIDFGLTWEANSASSVIDDVPNQIRKLDNGSLLVITRTKHAAKAFLSDNNEENFTLKYEFETSVGDVFGVDVYEDLIFVSGYGGIVNYDKCFMSKDYGKTWEIILQHPDPSISHFHDIRYDPYEGIIWACSGDYGIKNNIFYSSDFGKTWDTTYDGVTEGGVRATAIIPMPKCVLFVSDTDGELFVWRYDRLPNGTQGHVIKPYKAWYHRRSVSSGEPGAGGKDFVGSLPAITYGADSSAFFGWHCYTASSNSIPANVFATKDGYSFTPIWTSKNAMQANYTGSVEGGVLGVFGPTISGELVAAFREGDGTNPINYAIKLDFPGWG